MQGCLSGSVMVTHTRDAWMLSLVLVASSAATTVAIDLDPTASVKQPYVGTTLRT